MYVYLQTLSSSIDCRYALHFVFIDNLGKYNYNLGKYMYCIAGMQLMDAANGISVFDHLVVGLIYSLPTV